MFSVLHIDHFYFLSAILDFVGVLDSVLKVVAYENKFNPLGPNFTPFLPKTNRFGYISFLNYIMQYLSMEFTQGLGKRVTIGDFIVPLWWCPM